MKTDRYYQWLPNSGFDNEIVKLESIFIDDGEIFYKFSNDEVCNEKFIAKYTTDINDLKGKFIVELANKKDIWKEDIIKSKNVIGTDIQSNDGRNNKEIPPIEDIINLPNGSETGEIVSNVGKIRLIAPINKKIISPIDYKDYMSKKDLYTMGLEEKYEEIKEEKDEKDIKEEKDILTEKKEEVLIKKNKEEKTFINNKINENDPVAILVNTSAKNDILVPMELKIKLPSIEIFNIISKNFQDGDKKFIDVILSNIDYEIIKTSLKDALYKAYSQKEKIE